MDFRRGIIPYTNANRPATKLNVGYGVWVTVHETANTDYGADAEMHRKFLAGGGGPETVSFHFAVDDHEAVQLLPLDEIGWHAGDGCDDYPDGQAPDDYGCFSSIAIETCVNGDGDWAKTKENLVELISMILQGDSRLDWGDGRAKAKVSQWKIAQHNAWSGKDCPHRIRAEGSWDTIVAQVRAKLGLSSPPKYTPPLPIPTPWDGTDKKQTGTVWYAINRLVEVKADTIPRAWATSNKDEAKAGEAWKKGKKFWSKYMVQNGSGEWWYVTQEGFRILMSKCKEQFRPKGY